MSKPKHTHLIATLPRRLPTGERLYCVLCHEPLVTFGQEPASAPPVTDIERRGMNVIEGVKLTVATGRSLQSTLDALGQADRAALSAVLEPMADRSRDAAGTEGE